MLRNREFFHPFAAGDWCRLRAGGRMPVEVLGLVVDAES